MGFDYEKVEKSWFKPNKDIIKVNLDLKGIKNLENYIADLEQSRYVLDELEKWLEKQFLNTRDIWYVKIIVKIQELKKECR